MPTGVYKRSEKTKRKISETLKKKGIRPPLISFSSEIRKKLSNSHKGKPSGMLGKKHSEKAKRKVSQFQKQKWDKIGRKQYKRYIHSCSSLKYKIWRMKVFIRDNYTCQVCKKVGGYLEAHHIKSWAKYPKLRYKIDNGITLCKECHNLIPKNS